MRGFDGAAIASILPGHWYTVADVAAMCGRTEATVFGWLRKPDCPLVTKPKPLGLYGRLISGESLLAHFGHLAAKGAVLADFETKSERRKRAEEAQKGLK